MKHSTYTVLVTIAHDDDIAIPDARLSVIFGSALQPRGIAGVNFARDAVVSVIAGDALRFPLNKTDPAYPVKKLHRSIRV